MAKASWNGKTLVESDDIAHVEGNAYFPKEAVQWGYLKLSANADTFCHWKGFARYLDIVVDGEVNEGAAWEYIEPYDQASEITGRIAFWKGVVIEDAPEGRGLVEPSPSLRDGKTGWEALCWLLRHPPRTELDGDDVRSNTDLTADTFDDAWNQTDVQRYAKRYRWTLEGGSGAPIKLTQAPGDPVKVF